MDKGKFYSDEIEEVLEKKPAAAPVPAKPAAASNAPIYIDHRHRVFNDQGLILVVCGICTSRVHFEPNKAGTQQQCPDCHTKFLLPQLPPGPERKAESRPIVDDGDEFKLEETFERPGYQSLTRDSAAPELIHGAAPISAPMPPLPAGGAASAPPAFPGSGSRPAAPPVAIPNLPTPSTPIPPASVPSAPGFPVPPGPNSHAPPSFAPSPSNGDAATTFDLASRLAKPPNWAILINTFEFAFRPHQLLVLIIIAGMILAPIVLSLAMAAMAPAFAPIIFGALDPPLLGPALLFLFSFMVHVVHDSSYGERDAENWRFIDIAENAVTGLYVPFAIVFAGLPGLLIGILLSPLFGQHVLAATIGLSVVICFPYTLLALLEEESYWQCYSPEVLASFRRSAEQVFLFGCSAFMFTCVCAALVFGFVFFGGTEPSVLKTSLIFAGVTLIFCYWAITYARMVGRLAWVMNYEAKYGPLDDD